MKETIGVIGLGTIGKPIAERLLHAGYTVAVHDIRAEPVAALAAAGASACRSAADVAAESTLIISLVLDSVQTDDVVFGDRGILRSIRPRRTCARTCTPHWSSPRSSVCRCSSARRPR